MRQHGGTDLEFLGQAPETGRPREILHFWVIAGQGSVDRTDQRAGLHGTDTHHATPLARGTSGRIPILRFGTPQKPDRSSATKSGHFIRYGQAHSAPIDGSPLPFKITLDWANPADTGQVSWGRRGPTNG